MVEKDKALVIDLTQFKLHINIEDKISLSLHFNSESRRFYLAVIALVIHEMKKLGKIISIPLEKHYDTLALLNETVGGQAGSSNRDKLFPRIYKKWRNDLPDLEHAFLFRVLGKKKEYDDAAGKAYQFTDEEKDAWANLFDYKGSLEQVRLRFSIDKLGATLDDVLIIYEDNANLSDQNGWDSFLKSLKKITEEDFEQTITQHGEAVLERMAFPLPDKPSIAVLPFTNLSGDPEQEYLCDGITEEIITTLSKISNMFVIARNSTFTYKGKAVEVRQVAEELGTRYILEGSVRKVGNRVRITAQLVDATTGYHLWAERYDQDLDDIFALQDDISQTIVKALEVKLTKGEQEYLGQAPTDNPEAYDFFLRGKQYVYRFTKEGNVLARQMFERAVELDPEFALGYAWLGWPHLSDILRQWSKSPAQSLQLTFEMAQKALALDDSLANAYIVMGWVYALKRQHEQAIAQMERAISLEPNSAMAYAYLGAFLMYSGRPEEAIGLLEIAMRLDPMPQLDYPCILGVSYEMMGRYEKAIASLKKALERDPDYLLAHLRLAINYAHMGQEVEALEAAAEVRRLNPNFSGDFMVKMIPYKNQEDIERLKEGLSKAGLME